MVFSCPNCNRIYKLQGKRYHDHIAQCNNNMPPTLHKRVSTAKRHNARENTEIAPSSDICLLMMKLDENRRQDEERRDRFMMEREERRDRFMLEMEERREKRVELMEERMEERRRREEEARLERKDEKLRILREQTDIQRQALECQRETLDFHKQVYLECKTERALYIQDKNRIADNINNRPCIMSSTDICQKGELVVYGTRADPCFRRDDLKTYIEDLTTGIDSEFAPVIEAIQEYVDSASFDSSIQSVYSEDIQSSRFIPVGQWEECSIIMEEMSECPPQLIARHLRNIDCHNPYSPYCDIKSYNKKKLFNILPMIPDSKRFEDVGAIISTKNLPSDEHRKAVGDIRRHQGNYDDTVFSIHTLNDKKKEIRSRWDVYKKHGRTKRRRCHNIMNLVGYNRARLVVIHNRLKRNGVYHPDFMERYLQDQIYKKRNEDTHTNTKRCFMTNRFADSIVGNCDLCGKKRTQKEIELGHVVPAMRDKNGVNTTGTNGLHNLVVTCTDCNKKVASMDPYLGNHSM